MEITHLTGAHHRHLRALEVHSFRLPAEANFYHGQSFSINRPRQSSLFGHKLSPNEPFLALLAADSQKKKRVYKDAGPFFVTHSFCLPSTVEVFSPHTTSYRFQGTIHFHFLLTLTFSIYFMPSVQNTQTLPSFNLVHPPDHYTITIPNLSYPSRSNAHIAWTGSSAPLLFSVSQTFLFFVFLPHNLTSFALRKTRVQR